MKNPEEIYFQHDDVDLQNTCKISLIPTIYLETKAQVRPERLLDHLPFTDREETPDQGYYHDHERVNSHVQLSLEKTVKIMKL